MNQSNARQPGHDDLQASVLQLHLELTAIKACLQVVFALSPQLAQAVQKAADSAEGFALSLPLADTHSESVVALMRSLSSGRPAHR